MNRGMYFACALALGAGCAQGFGEESPTRLDPAAGDVREAAHIYYNMGTGERVVTLLENGQAPESVGESTPIWSVTNTAMCADYGLTTEFVFILDDNSDLGPLATGMTLRSLGDLPTDTVVDCVRVTWVSDHADTDADSDGIGDGVEGLGSEWTYWDRDNGSSGGGWCNRFPLITFRLTDMPGDITGTHPDDPGNALTAYTMDIDLIGDFGNDLSFEIGDSDGDCQGAGFCSNDIDTDGDGIGDGVSVANVDMDFDGLPDSDLDGDGLFDWAWTVRFYQPGTADQDGDGSIDGDPADSMRAIGLQLAVPDGQPVDLGGEGWVWETDTTQSDAGTGVEDVYELWDDWYTLQGLFWLGGFSCDLNDKGQYTPFSSFKHQLLGPAIPDEPCPADLTGDGTVNFLDISAFIQQHNAGGDYNGDGATNFFDIAAYIQDFSAGCP